MRRKLRDAVPFARTEIAQVRLLECVVPFADVGSLGPAPERTHASTSPGQR